jgi:hypothetical protein
MILFAGDYDFEMKKTNTNKLNRKALPTLVDALDNKPVELKKLPNGNYSYVCIFLVNLPF